MVFYDLFDNNKCVFLLIRNKTLDYDCQQLCHKTKKSLQDSLKALKSIISLSD